MDRLEQKSIDETIERSKEFLKPRRSCLINADIDGILSGLVLHNFLNWEVIGFCDSKDSLWVEEKQLSVLNDSVYVDIFVAHPELKCIDQHIVAKDEKHALSLGSNPLKQNPNFQRIRYASPNQKDSRAYAWKYPFGSVHYIIACLEAIGEKVSIDSSIQVSGEANLFDLILRADDAARSTAKNYRENALDWWAWLELLGGKQTRDISKYAQKQTAEDAFYRHDLLARMFKKDFGCSSNDGNFANLLKNSSRELNHGISSYIGSVADWMGLESFLLKGNYKRLAGKFLLEAVYKTEEIEGILKRKDLFSYAFTYCMGPLAAKGFSYTLWPPDGKPN